jgi:hypothetical protein
MADFITTKANGDSLDASEWNQLEEIDNAIDSSGLTLTTAQKDQLKISMARYASGANFYTDGGSANAYVLTSISHGGGKSFAPAGAGAVNYFNGMNVRFRPANNNSGASTVNVSSFGLKDIRKSDGTTALTGGELTTANDVILRYDSTNSCFIIQEYAKATTTTQGVSYLNNPITIANNATTPNTDIDFSAGNFVFSDGSGQAIASALTKRLQSSGAWSAGANGNLLLTGARANSSTYHLFAMSKADGTTDYGALLGVANTDPNPTSALPSGYTKFERVGSVLTDASGNIRAFTQNGKFFSLTTPVLSQSYTVTANSRLPYAMTCPTGLNVYVNIMPTTSKNTAGNSQTWVSDLATTNIDPIFNSGFETMKGNLTYSSNSEIWRKTNKSSEIGIRTNNSTSSSEIKIVTMGWQDINLKY